MKRILFLAISATLLAIGCQKTEVINPVADSLTFTTDLGKLTKVTDEELDLPDAEGSGVGNLQAQHFKVWSYTVFADANNGITAGQIYDYMDGIPVTYANSVWSTKDEHYWPGTGKKLDFFAVSTGKWASMQMVQLLLLKAMKQPLQLLQLLLLVDRVIRTMQLLEK
ncbi:MAG: fimbrillin family protein [Prevotella sp.]|nr:fimbrillin family protein [Prevotella sp.]